MAGRRARGGRWSRGLPYFEALKLATELGLRPLVAHWQEGYTFEAPGTVAPIIGAVLGGSKGSGPRTRTIPASLRRALRHRDHGCRFPGCGIRFGQGHHIQHWANGGPTTLSNLAMLCRRHHRSVHEDGYPVERLSDGTLEFRRPDGRVVPDVPGQPPITGDPVLSLREANAANGVGIDARTSIPNWDGHGLNVGWAIDVLHPLANPL